MKLIFTQSTGQGIGCGHITVDISISFFHIFLPFYNMNFEDYYKREMICYKDEYTFSDVCTNMITMRRVFSRNFRAPADVSTKDRNWNEWKWIFVDDTAYSSGWKLIERVYKSIETLIHIVKDVVLSSRQKVRCNEPKLVVMILGKRILKR